MGQIQVGRPQAYLYEGVWVWSARIKNGRKTQRQRSLNERPKGRMVCVMRRGRRRRAHRSTTGKRWQAKRGYKNVADTFRPRPVGAGNTCQARTSLADTPRRRFCRCQERVRPLCDPLGGNSASSVWRASLDAASGEWR